MKKIFIVLLLSLIALRMDAWSLVNIEVNQGKQDNELELVLNRTSMLNIYYTAMQFELLLTEDVSLDVDDVKLAAHLSHHEVIAEQVGNGRWLVMIYSPENEPIVLGEIVKMKLKNNSPITQQGAIQHICLSTFDGILLGDFDIPFTIDANLDGICEVKTDYTEEPFWYSLDGRVLTIQPSQKGIYIKDGKKFVK